MEEDVDSAGRLGEDLWPKVDPKLVEDSHDAPRILADALMKKSIEQGWAAPFIQ